MRRLSLAFCGCGSRARTYAGIAAGMGDQFTLVAAADPVPERVAAIRQHAGNPAGFRSYASAEAMFAEGKLADVVVIATQDAQHREHALRAMELGCDLLLEKPIAHRREDTLAVREAARRLGRRVVVCHVLRYTPFYAKVQSLLRGGAIGEIVSANFIEGVQPWHQAHSFVRGHWSVEAKSSPMILAKSCHDMDLLAWLIDRPCLAVSSHGALTHFTAAQAPAGAPARCTDGCPAAATCRYDAHLYARPEGRRWLAMVYDRAKEATAEEIHAWLRTSPWGRCVYRCDNDVVDHQVIAARFAGEVTATFTMTAFDEGRQLEIFGTEGVLRGGAFVKKQLGCDLALTRHGWEQPTERITVETPAGGYAGHGGGDHGLMSTLHADLTCPDAATMRTSLEVSLQSHLMAFAAEESRRTGRTVTLAV
jgi:predicted dehydrogenase